MAVALLVVVVTLVVVLLFVSGRPRRHSGLCEFPLSLIQNGWSQHGCDRFPEVLKASSCNFLGLRRLLVDSRRMC